MLQLTLVIDMIKLGWWLLSRVSCTYHRVF